MSLDSENQSRKLSPTFVVVILAAFVLLGVLALINSQNFQSAQTLQKLTETSKGPQAKSTHFLTLDQPEDNLVVQVPKLTVSGTTSAGSTVAVIAGDDSQIGDADSSGRFSLTVNLSEGQTSIEATSFSPNGEEKVVTRDVIYTTSGNL